MSLSTVLARLSAPALQVETVLPVQLTAPPADTPVRKLLRAFLVVTITDVLSPAKRCGVNDEATVEAVRADALAWFNDDDVSHVCSFLRVCEAP